MLARTLRRCHRSLLLPRFNWARPFSSLPPAGFCGQWVAAALTSRSSRECRRPVATGRRRCACCRHMRTSSSFLRALCVGALIAARSPPCIFMARHRALFGARAAWAAGLCLALALSTARAVDPCTPGELLLWTSRSARPHIEQTGYPAVPPSAARSRPPPAPPPLLPQPASWTSSLRPTTRSQRRSMTRGRRSWACATRCTP